MSPSEDELRAALRHGEGEGVDVDGLVQHAVAVRRGRRIRVAAVAAAVIAVAGVGVGAAVVSARHTDHTTTAHSPLPGHTPPDGLAATTPAPAPNSSEQRDGLAAACPLTEPEPAIVKHPQGAEQGPLISTPVATVVVCAYFANRQVVADSNGAPIVTTLPATPATALADSLNGADLAPHPTSSACSTAVSLFSRTLVMIPTGPTGKPGLAVFSPIDRPTGCNTPTSNGVALRYNWRLPPLLAGYLDEIRKVTPVLPGGANSGSPAN